MCHESERDSRFCEIALEILFSRVHQNRCCPTLPNTAGRLSKQRLACRAMFFRSSSLEPRTEESEDKQAETESVRTPSDANIVQEDTVDSEEAPAAGGGYFGFGGKPASLCKVRMRRHRRFRCCCSTRHGPCGPSHER